jgi:hypothetical protein
MITAEILKIDKCVDWARNQKPKVPIWIKANARYPVVVKNYPKELIL